MDPKKAAILKNCNPSQASYCFLNETEIALWQGSNVMSLINLRYRIICSDFYFAELGSTNLKEVRIYRSVQFFNLIIFYLFPFFLIYHAIAAASCNNLLYGPSTTLVIRNSQHSGFTWVVCLTCFTFIYAKGSGQ